MIKYRIPSDIENIIPEHYSIGGSFLFTTSLSLLKNECEETPKAY